jgi:hypothetical protein
VKATPSCHLTLHWWSPSKAENQIDPQKLCDGRSLAAKCRH